MRLPKFILRHIPKGYVVITESNHKNAAQITAHFRRYRLKTLHANTFEEAKKLLGHKKVFGAMLDHTFTHDHDHTGVDVLKYIRRDLPYDQQKLPTFLVANVVTVILQEYEYLKITRFFDTDEHRVAYVIDEIATYIIG